MSKPDPVVGAIIHDMHHPPMHGQSRFMTRAEAAAYIEARLPNVSADNRLTLLNWIGTITKGHYTRQSVISKVGDYARNGSDAINNPGPTWIQRAVDGPVGNALVGAGDGVKNAVSGTTNFLSGKWLEILLVVVLVIVVVKR